MYFYCCGIRFHCRFMAPKRTKCMSMEELIPPSPVRPRKGQSQARSTKRTSASGQYKRPRSNTTGNQQEVQLETPTATQSETSQHHVSETSQEEPVTTQLHDSGQITQRAKKGRGAACGMPEWGTGKLIHIEFDANWMPISENGKGFSSQLGILARDGEKVPLTYTSWNAMPDDILDAIWKDVKDNTDVPDEYKQHCLKVVGSRWRDWKCRVKTQWYDKYETDEQRLTFIPSQVVGEQWKILVKYWGLPQIKEMCETNKSSRAQGGGVPHRTGRKSFARLRKEMMENGEKTDRVSMFVKTRAMKTKDDDGQPIEIHDEEATAVISQFNEYLEERPDEQDNTFREEVFTKVMGEDAHGRVRMYGTGVTPSQVFGNSKAYETNEKRTIEEMDRKYEEMEKNYQTKLDDLKLSHESQLGDMKLKYDDVSNRLNLLMSHVGIQVNPSGSTSEQVCFYYFLFLFIFFKIPRV
ncbi:uncharacterized protein LOC133725289 isoform X1 [Rosa rugosa]|uniref:uncharacterized protein LOC133725289 isoform X1 n=1 Tax=Rosa rugosa TaxID=74645 RepID=UPI002B410AC6|nr:uncharacterized protein LOC133725289 isoform X1 [Rosa rugosa]